MTHVMSHTCDYLIFGLAKCRSNSLDKFSVIIYWLVTPYNVSGAYLVWLDILNQLVKWFLKKIIFQPPRQLFVVQILTKFFLCLNTTYYSAHDIVVYHSILGEHEMLVSCHGWYWETLNPVRSLYRTRGTRDWKNVWFGLAARVLSVRSVADRSHGHIGLASSV